MNANQNIIAKACKIFASRIDRSNSSFDNEMAVICASNAAGISYDKFVNHTQIEDGSYHPIFMGENVSYVSVCGVFKLEDMRKLASSSDNFIQLILDAEYEQNGLIAMCVMQAAISLASKSLLRNVDAIVNTCNGDCIGRIVGKFIVVYSF